MARLAIAANAFGWGRDRRTAHFPADVSAEHRRHVADRRRAQRAGAFGVCSTPAPASPARSCRGFEHYKLMPIVRSHGIAIAAVMVLAWRGARACRCLQFEIRAGGDRHRLRRACRRCLRRCCRTACRFMTFGTAVATMQFSRNLYCTIMVVGVRRHGAGRHRRNRDGRSRWWAIRPTASCGCSTPSAGSFAVALMAMILIEEKPLQTTHA